MSAPPTGRESLRITLVNQFYPPDLAPTAHLTASLAAHLAGRGHTVTVIAGGSDYVDAPRGGRARRGDGVHVVRLWMPALGKGSVLKRLIDYFAFLVGAASRLLVMKRQDVIISLTTPPYVVLGALAHKVIHRRTRVVLWSMDCYPDVLERLGSRTSGSPAARPAARSLPSPRSAVSRLRRRALSLRHGRPASRVLRAVNRWAFRRLDHVVALDDAMAALLEDGYATDGTHPPMTVIPNWEPLEAFPEPDGPSRPAAWSAYLDEPLQDRFVVLYLGNLGYGHRVETVVDAAAALTEADAVSWLFVGGGARWAQLGDLVDAAGVDASVIRRPYVPKERTGAVLAGAHCALILLADEALGVMSPSKLHANLAAGLPILYVGPEGSNVDLAIARFGCGISLRTGDHVGLVDAVRRLRDDLGWRDELARAARSAFEAAYSDRAVLPCWDELVEPGWTGQVLRASTVRK